MSRAVSMRIPTARTVGPEAAGNLEPRDARQTDVEDHGVEAGRLTRDLEAGLAVGRKVDDVAVVLEESAQEPAELGIVFDEQEVHGCPG